MKKKLLSIVLTLCMVLTLLPAVSIPAAAAEHASDITGSETWSDGDTVSALSITGGTAESPIVITVTGTVTVNGTITIPSGSYVKIIGGTLQRGSSFISGSMLQCAENLTLENTTIDGNNVTASGSGTAVGVSSGTLNIGDRTVIRNFKANSSNMAVVYIGGGIGNMTGGEITGNALEKGYSSVVKVCGGTFNMSGGSIHSNSVGEYSSGLFVDGGAANLRGSAQVYGNTYRDGRGYNV